MSVLSQFFTSVVDLQNLQKNPETENIQISYTPLSLPLSVFVSLSFFRSYNSEFKPNMESHQLPFPKLLLACLICSSTFLFLTTFSQSAIQMVPYNGDLVYSSASVAPPEFAPLVPRSASDSVTRSDFQPYLASVSDHYNRVVDIINHVKKEKSDVDSIGGQGEALVACLREVPALYFKDFAPEDGTTFRSPCPFTNVSENLVQQEKLSHYLDVVEFTW